MLWEAGLPGQPHPPWQAPVLDVHAHARQALAARLESLSHEALPCISWVPRPLAGAVHLPR